MKSLMQYFMRALIRRSAYVLLALLGSVLGAAFSAGSAHAALANTSSPDEGEAWMKCHQTGAEAVAYYQPLNKTQTISYTCTRASGVSFYTGVSGSVGGHLIGYSHAYSLDCAQRPGVLANATDYRQADYMTCVGSCQVSGNWSTAATGGVTLTAMTDRYYTGEVCQKQKVTNDPVGEKSEAAKEGQPECTALGGGQTACLKPDGKYCATASTGKTFCWTPQEEGKKVDGNDAQVKGKEGEAVTPPDVKIDDKDWQRKEGHKAEACINGKCTTYNVTNFETVPSGTAKNSTGDNNGDGSGNTSGNGKPSKGDDDGKEKGDGDSAADSGNCEAPPSCTGDTLKCLHLRYTWKTECNTRPSEMTKGDGCGENDVPICAGSSCKAEAYSGVLQQWKQRCAMQALGEGMATRAGGISNGDDAGVLDGIWGGQSGGTGLTLRQDLINVGGGSGSLLPDVEIEGQRWNVPAGFYDAIAGIRLVIIAMCTVIAMFVVGRSI